MRVPARARDGPHIHELRHALRAQESSMARVPWPMVRITSRGQLGASVVRAIRDRRGSIVRTVMYGRESVVVEGARALECPAPLLPRLRLLSLPLDRRLLVVGAPFHLLKEAVLLHLLLERLQRRLDLVVDDLDPHSAAPQVRGRSIAAYRRSEEHTSELQSLAYL